MNQEETREAEAALKTLLAFSRNTPRGGGRTPWGGGLMLDPSGACRLANIAGYLTGLWSSGALSPVEMLSQGNTGPRELALELAMSLDRQLSYLAGYGGDREIVVDPSEGDERGPVSVEVPAYKVVLYDDGTFGGFGVLWHSPISEKRFMDVAREQDEGAYEGKENGSTIPEKEQTRRWAAALQAAGKTLGIRKDLEEIRGWVSHRTQDKRAAALAHHREHSGDDFIYGCKEEGCRRQAEQERGGGQNEYIRYGFNFNGGLLLHGMSSNPFAVDIGGSSPRWSIHT